MDLETNKQQVHLLAQGCVDGSQVLPQAATDPHTRRKCVGKTVPCNLNNGGFGFGTSRNAQPRNTTSRLCIPPHTKQNHKVVTSNLTADWLAVHPRQGTSVAQSCCCDNTPGMPIRQTVPCCAASAVYTFTSATPLLACVNHGPCSHTGRVPMHDHQP